MSTKRARKRTNSTTSVDYKTAKRVKLTISRPSFPVNTQTGVVLVTGGGDVGQLGLGSDIFDRKRPTLVKIDHEIVDICAGGMHTVCLTKDGQVITFGCNDEGALGRNTAGKDEAEFEPELVTLPDKVIQVSAGDSHTAALLENGKVYAWGTFRDSHGNMGMTMNGNERLPYEILPNETVVKIASGGDHLVMLTNHGQVYTCGCAEQGQLGRTTERNSDRNALRGGISILLTPKPISTKLSLKLIFENVWAGTYCTFAKVHGKNDVYVFGLNNYYQLGLKKPTVHFSPTLSKEFSKRNWKQICCAQHHAVALDEDGKVFSIGRKEYGRLGLGSECPDATDITQVPALQDKTCVYIGCGSASSFAVTDNGDLYAWGMGDSGQLGTGEEDDCCSPTLIKGKQLQERQVVKVSSGGQHTVMLALTSNNNVKMNNSE